ncbi:MAG: cytochrome-c peroxidase [Planctomycetota bacterium]|nr:cytochrome-c peroxidase [Planctomycetales bacterium]RLT01458.1 MAG: cytochrome-c peroxidase [Planctomycetota bacterium]
MLKIDMKRCLLWTLTLTLTTVAASAQQSTLDLGKDELVLGIPGSGPLTNARIEEWLSQEVNHQALTVKLPLGLSLGESQMKGLQKNPLTLAKIELGRQLYFDTRLSADNTVSCASCHHPQDGYSRHTPTGVGIRGQKGGRNSPSSYNRILSDAQFWDGRAGSLEAQAVGPIQNPIEMGNTHAAAVATLEKIDGYKLQFMKIFPDSGVTIDNVGSAIAAFERILVTGATSYDYNESYKRFAALSEEDLDDLKTDSPETYAEYEEVKLLAELNPMSESALRGQDLFFSKRVGCSNCHVGANLADEQYHNLGVGMSAKEPDLGRFAETKAEKDKGAFKTPTIRNVALSAPYMHDGSLATLEEVVEHYNKGGAKNPWLSDKILPLKLTPLESNDLVEFMRACTGSFPFVTGARLPQ